jgi:hypothetical protein
VRNWQTLAYWYAGLGVATMIGAMLEGYTFDPVLIATWPLNFYKLVTVGPVTNAPGVSASQSLSATRAVTPIG